MATSAGDQDKFYALRLNKLGSNGKPCYYVGKSKDVDKRVEDHRSGRSRIPWISMHGGIAEVIPVDPTNGGQKTTEMYETVRRMMENGMDNVRGSSWTCDQPLSQEDRDNVHQNASCFFNLCRTCGNEGHFANACTAPDAPWLSDFEGVNTTRRQIKRAREEPTGCERCGYPSHSVNDCYAKYDVNGEVIYDDSDTSADSGTEDETEAEESYETDDEY
jgi:hypothetical protein